jgi:hypothetical protein
MWKNTGSSICDLFKYDEGSIEGSNSSRLRIDLLGTQTHELDPKSIHNCFLCIEATLFHTGFCVESGDVELNFSIFDQKSGNPTRNPTRNTRFSGLPDPKPADYLGYPTKTRFSNSFF